MFRFFIFFVFIIFYCRFDGKILSAQKRVYDAPLPIPLLLSGSFGELRETHFHSGVDLKTGGVVGVPVIGMAEGIVSRVKVSSVGYGNALYVEHADGTTTVYGHLLRYTPEVTRIIREKQYEGESFEVDLDMKAYGITFRPGDTLAYTGNTGSSGGPHLHFEYRDTRTEAVLNPLLFLKIEDNIVPKIRALYLYYMTEDGCVERRKRIVPKYLGNRKYGCGEITVSPGRNGVGFYLTDVMNGSWNKLGIYRMEMSVDGEKKFEMQVDTCLFDCNPLVNEIKDFELYRSERETVYRTFGRYMSRIPGVKIADEGWIDIGKGEKKKGCVKVADINGNEAEFCFTFVARDSFPFRERKVLDCRREHVIEEKNYKLLLDDSALFVSLPYVGTADTMTLADGRLYTVFCVSCQERPLFQAARLEVKGRFDETAVVCRVTDKKTLVALPTCYGENGLSAISGYIGSYAVVSDTVAPVVKYIGMASGMLKFVIQDQLSGIATYRGEVNGKWGLFEYDAKNDLLTCRVNEPVFVRGRNEVRLVVKDKVGNITEKQIVLQLGK